MTSRSRMLFWGLTSILALLLLLVACVVGFRTWQVEHARRAVASNNVEVYFLYHGPKWLEPILPDVIGNAWWSCTDIDIFNRSETLPRFNDRDWQAVLPAIQQLPDLVGLSFWQAGIDTQTLRSLADFPMLFRLQIVDSRLTDEQLARLSRCPQLYALNLSQNAITDDGLRHLAGLSNLRELTLDGTRITEDGFVHLRRLTNLKQLSVVNTGLRESALMSLETDRPGLMISDD